MNIVSSMYPSESITSIFGEVANLSSTFNVTFHEYDENLEQIGDRHWLLKAPGNRFGAGMSMLDAPVDMAIYHEIPQCTIGIDFPNKSDVLALAGIFVKFVAFDEQVLDGFYSGPSEIICFEEGDVFGFRLNAYESVKYLGDKTGYLYSKADEDHTCIFGFNIYALSEQPIQIGFIRFCSGRYTALLVAHDLAVMQALIEGVPEASIREKFLPMKKLLIAKGYSGDFDNQVNEE